MKKCTVELLEWVDITEHRDKDPFKNPIDMVELIHPVLVLGEFEKDGKKILRCGGMVGKKDNDRHNSEYHDIPLGNIKHRKVLCTIKLNKDREFIIDWKK